MTENLKFIVSPTFWSMVLTVSGGVLVDPNFPTQPWYITLGKWLLGVAGGFTVVGTINRNADKKLDMQRDVARINADVSVKEAEKSIK